MEFWVKATWDSDSGVFVSESNIKGLHLKAETLREFQDEMLRIAPELIIDNHGDEEPEKTRARDMPITEAFWAYGKQPLQRDLQPRLSDTAADWATGTVE